MIIAVDFDGTCVTNEYPKVGKNIGAGPVLRLLKSKGIKLMLWTLRGNFRTDFAGRTFDRSLLHYVHEWSVQNGVVWDYINKYPDSSWTDSKKQFADIYIDDSALGCPLLIGTRKPCVDWLAVLRMLRPILNLDSLEYNDTAMMVSKEIKSLKHA